MYMTKRKLGYFACADKFCKTTFKMHFDPDLENQIYCPICGGLVRECSEEEMNELDNNSSIPNRVIDEINYEPNDDFYSDYGDAEDIKEYE